MRRYWEQDFVQENPKVTLRNIQDLFASQDTRVQQLKDVYKRALTYKGGDLTSASDIVKVLALKKEGGLFVDHDMFPKGEEILQDLFDFINNNPDKVYLFKPRGLKIAEYAFEIKNIIATSQNSNFINHIIDRIIQKHTQLSDDPFTMLVYEREQFPQYGTLNLTGSFLSANKRYLDQFLEEMLQERRGDFASYEHYGESKQKVVVVKSDLSRDIKQTVVDSIRTTIESVGLDGLGFLKVYTLDPGGKLRCIFRNEPEKFGLNARDIDIYTFGNQSFAKKVSLALLGKLISLKNKRNWHTHPEADLENKFQEILSLSDAQGAQGGEPAAIPKGGLFGKHREEYVKEIEKGLLSGDLTYESLSTYQRLLADRYITGLPTSTNNVFEDTKNFNVFELEKNMKKQLKANEALIALVKEWKEKSVVFLESQGLDPKQWIPLTKETVKLENGNYQIKYLKKASNSSIEEKIETFEVSDDIHLRLKMQIEEMATLDISLKGLGEGATSRGIGQAGMGLAMGIQALVHSTSEHWWGNKELKGIYFNALRAQLVVNLTQAVLSVPMTVLEIVGIYRELIGSVIPRTFSSIFDIEGAINIGFSIANLVLDSIQFSSATTPQQKVYSGVMVGFDTAALGLGLVAIGLGVAGISTASAVAGEFIGPIIATGFGVAILAQGYQARLDEAEAIATFFTDRRDEYFATNIVDLNDSNRSQTYQYTDISVPIKSIDFKSGMIYLEPFYVYDSKYYNQGPHGVHKCAYYNRYDAAHRTPQQKQDDAINAIDVWRKYSQGMETKYSSQTPVNIARLTTKLFDPSLSHIFVLPSIAPYYVAYRYKLVSFSSTDHALKYVRPFNEFGADYNPGDSVDQAWSKLEIVKSLKSHDMYIMLDDANRTLVQPKADHLSQGVLNYRIFGPSSKFNHKRRIDIVSNASKGGKNNHFFIYRGRNQDFVISGLKGLPEYKGVEHFDINLDIGTSYEGTIPNVGHMHFKVGDDHIYISTIPQTSNGVNVNIYFVSDGSTYKVVGDSYENIGSEFNITSFHGDIIQKKQFLEQHTLPNSIVHVGNLMKLKEADNVYGVPTWFAHNSNMLIYPQLSRSNKDHDIELLKLTQDKNETRAYFMDHSSKKVFSNLVDQNITHSIVYSEVTKRLYFDSKHSGDIVDAFVSYANILMAYTQNGYLYSLIKDKNDTQVYSIIGLNYDTYTNSGKIFLDLNSSLDAMVKSFKDNNITLLKQNFIEITRAFNKDDTSRSYWYDLRKNQFTYKNGSYKQHENNNILVDIFDHYGLIYNGESKRLYMTPIVSYDDVISQNTQTFTEKEILTNIKNCLDHFRYEGNGIFYGSTCSHQKVFRAENGLGQYRRYQIAMNGSFNDTFLVTSKTIALYPQFMIPNGQNTLEYLRGLIYDAQITLDASTEYLPWFKDKDHFKFYVIPDQNGSFKYGAQFYVGTDDNGLGKYADRNYTYVGYDKSEWRGYVFKKDTKELIEIHHLNDITSIQPLQSIQAYRTSILLELIDKNSTQESELVVPYIDNRKLLSIVAKDKSKIIFKDGLKDYSLSTDINIDLSEINSTIASSLEINAAFGDNVEIRDSYFGKVLTIKEGNTSKGSIFLSGFRPSSEVNGSDTKSSAIHIALKLKSGITKTIKGYIRPDKDIVSTKYHQLYEDSLRVKLKEQMGHIIVSNKMQLATNDRLNSLQLVDDNNTIYYISNKIKTIGKDYLIALKPTDSNKSNVYVYLQYHIQTGYDINILGNDDRIVGHLAKLQYNTDTEKRYRTIDLTLQGTPNKNYPVCFYTDANYLGNKHCIKYNTYAPYLFIPFDNNISSIQFSQEMRNLYVRVYTGKGFMTHTTRYSTSHPVLHFPFDNNISSFVVSNDNITKLPFGTKILDEPNANYPVCLYDDSNTTRVCYTQGSHLVENNNATLHRISVYGDWQIRLYGNKNPFIFNTSKNLTSRVNYGVIRNAPIQYITVKRPDPLVLLNRYFMDTSLRYTSFQDAPFNKIDTGIYLPQGINKIKLTYNHHAIEVTPVVLGDDYLVKIANFNSSNKILELYFKKTLLGYTLYFYGSQDILNTISTLKIEYIKNNIHYYIGSVVAKNTIRNNPYANTLQIFTSAFGSGCIANVQGYAQRQSCNPLNTNQFLTYTENHTLRNPSTNKCLTVLSDSSGSKIVYAQCHDHNQTQTFLYNSTTKQFLHAASRQCLDIDGDNKKDIILYGCHGSASQQFDMHEISQKIDEYNMTNEVPLVSIDYATQANRGTVYFIVPEQSKARGPTHKVWYQNGVSEIDILVLDNNRTYHTAKLFAQRSTRDCGTCRMNGAASCQTGNFSYLKVRFDRLANAHLPSGIYEGSFYILAKGWHDTSYTQTIQVSIELNLTNIAFNKPTQQSSTHHHDFHPSSMKAVDGNIDGNFNAKSTTHTNRDNHAWWQVDLQRHYTIDKIKIYNRTDCCSDRLNNAKVFISDIPFGNDSLQGAQDKAKWSGSITQAQSINTLDVNNTEGRYVRVQLEGRNYLSLAEVQVFGKKAANILHSVGMPKEYRIITVTKTNPDQTMNNLKTISALWASEVRITSANLTKIEAPRGFSSGDNIWFNFYEDNNRPMFPYKAIRGVRIRITEDQNTFKFQQTSAAYKVLETQEEYSSLLERSGGKTINPYLVNLETNRTGLIMMEETIGNVVKDISLEFR
ncbi:MAG: ricin-type beta-trefoil lectin domain protein [Sulfurovum sp.]|nr:ricin-type beta-trefoil lectin domain protein [Sulfurovum sp.]